MNHLMKKQNTNKIHSKRKNLNDRFKNVILIDKMRPNICRMLSIWYNSHEESKESKYTSRSFISQIDCTETRSWMYIVYSHPDSIEYVKNHKITTKPLITIGWLMAHEPSWCSRTNANAMKMTRQSAIGPFVCYFFLSRKQLSLLINNNSSSIWSRANYNHQRRKRKANTIKDRKKMLCVVQHIARLFIVRTGIKFLRLENISFLVFPSLMFSWYFMLYACLINWSTCTMHHAPCTWYFLFNVSK